jgi:hypothetical protein
MRVAQPPQVACVPRARHSPRDAAKAAAPACAAPQRARGARSAARVAGARCGEDTSSAARGGAAQHRRRGGAARVSAATYAGAPPAQLLSVHAAAAAAGDERITLDELYAIAKARRHVGAARASCASLLLALAAPATIGRASGTLTVRRVASSCADRGLFARRRAA